MSTLTPSKNQRPAMLICNRCILGINTDLTRSYTLLFVSDRIANALRREPVQRHCRAHQAQVHQVR
jgi:hypothetical protein